MFHTLLMEKSEPLKQKEGFTMDTNTTERRYFLGMDVGSTTVKFVVVDTKTDEILWRDYQRHETKQPEKCLEFLKRIDAD